jgi:hypothetical protein
MRRPALLVVAIAAHDSSAMTAQRGCLFLDRLLHPQVAMVRIAATFDKTNSIAIQWLVVVSSMARILNII